MQSHRFCNSLFIVKLFYVRCSLRDFCGASSPYLEEYGDVTFLQQSLQIGSGMLLVSLVSFWCTLYVESSDGDLLVGVFLCVCETGIHCFHPEVLQSLLEELWLWCSFYFSLCLTF